MTKVLPHIIPEIENWPIYRFSQNRASFISKMNESCFAKLAMDDQSIQEIIATTIYLEKIRVTTNPWKVDPGNEFSYWKKMEAEFKESHQLQDKDEVQIRILKKIINRYSEEIVGHFNPKTFRFASKFLTFFFRRLLNTSSGGKYLWLWGSKYQLYDRLLVKGELDTIRHLMTKGIVIVVPTHFSNLDSILVGYAIDAIVGLPAFSYGAGLNLYNVEVLAYFMNRLGAYKVDRRKKNPIYLECLKTFSCLSVQHGVNSIFFPGGTRSRSGAIESALKLGLLGTLVEAQREIYLNGNSSKIFIFPLITSYHFVLEAKELIDQHLKATGKEKYLKGKSETTNRRKIFKFLRKLFSAGSEISLNFASPLDVFGNDVDWDGNSLDAKGNKLDISDYYLLNGKMNADEQREKIYTQFLGKRILNSFRENNIVLSSHLVAYAGFSVLQHQNRKLDLYGVLNLLPGSFSIGFNVFQELIGRLQSELILMDNSEKIILSKELRWDVKKLIDNGIQNLGLYHPDKPLIILKSGSIGSQNLKLLYYYHNRLTGFGLEPLIEDYLDHAVENNMNHP